MIVEDVYARRYKLGKLTKVCQLTIIIPREFFHSTTEESIYSGDLLLYKRNLRFVAAFADGIVPRDSTI